MATGKPVAQLAEELCVSSNLIYNFAGGAGRQRRSASRRRTHEPLARVHCPRCEPPHQQQVAQQIEVTPQRLRWHTRPELR